MGFSTIVTELPQLLGRSSECSHCHNLSTRALTLLFDKRCVTQRLLKRTRPRIKSQCGFVDHTSAQLPRSQGKNRVVLNSRLEHDIDFLLHEGSILKRGAWRCYQLLPDYSTIFGGYSVSGLPRSLPSRTHISMGRGCKLENKAGRDLHGASNRVCYVDHHRTPSGRRVVKVRETTNLLNDF